ncbi:MAG: dihydropteroate synthase [Gammaproteobacteria bacterium]|nr:dihydropteroate synthase [Gammaproteobacteria bacterium]MBQ0773237.1 dihydropteroate synthase [Gammaproteobacteria bacterium]
MNTLLQCAARTLDLSAPVVMGVLNVTPDSFSDGGRFLDTDVMLRRVADMLAEGASLIDVGGESTRPGADPVSIQQELDRVIPAVEAIHSEFDTIISLDTSTPEVIRAGAAAGAGFINDVRALQREGALQAAADTGLPICLMHMQGEPATMQGAPSYDDVTAEVQAFFAERLIACRFAGIEENRIVLDPGFGFGKTDAQNVELLAALPSMMALGLPLLVGLSRKSMIGRLLGREVEDRMVGSVALALMAMERGASIVRAHDVAQTMDALRLFCAVNKRTTV